MARLLVVDDEPNVLYSIKKWLHCESLEVEVAQTGRQGLELTRSFHPDVMILDVRLTDMSGMEVFEHVRTLMPGCL